MSRRLAELVAITLCVLALRELTGELADLIGYRWASIPYFVMWFALCSVAAQMWGWPRLWATRSSWTRTNVLALILVLVGTDYLYNFKLPRLLAGDYALHAPYSVVFFVGAAIAAPVVEELLFRGVLWDAVRKRSNTAVALLLTSTLFAVWHWVSIFDPSWVGSGGTPIVMHGAFGALMGVLRWRFDAIGFGVVIHAFYNGLYTVTS